jgi:hypothetical protein
MHFQADCWSWRLTSPRTLALSSCWLCRIDYASQSEYRHDTHALGTGDTDQLCMSMRMITWTGIETGQGMLHAVLNLVVVHDKILENMVRNSQCSFNYYSKCFQAIRFQIPYHCVSSLDRQLATTANP